MRTFHIGGAASRTAASSHVEVKNDGNVSFSRIRSVRKKNGHNVVVSRSGELIIHDIHGVDRERYKVPDGAAVRGNDGDEVTSGQVIAAWEPHTHPIITEVAGKVRFDNIVEGISVSQQTDELTGTTTYLVLDSKQRRGTAPVSYTHLTLPTKA